MAAASFALAAHPNGVVVSLGYDDVTLAVATVQITNPNARAVVVSCVSPTAVRTDLTVSGAAPAGIVLVSGGLALVLPSTWTVFTRSS